MRIVGHGGTVVSKHCACWEHLLLHHGHRADEAILPPTAFALCVFNAVSHDCFNSEMEWNLLPC